MKRGWLGWLLAAVVVAGLVYGVVRWREARKPPPITYRTAKVEKRRIVGRITASGTLSARITVQVGAQVSGRIAKLFADWNSPVKKGQLVAQLDPLLFRANVEQAEANYESAKANVDKAESNAAQADRVLQRELALQKESLAAQQDVDLAQTNAATAKADIAVQKASLEQAKAQLDQARVNLSYTSIYSPIDGTVISRNVDVGQTVAASLQAPVLFTIAEDLKNMQVNTNVAEGDVGRLQPGQEATFTVDAFPGEKFRGRISQIRNAATTVSNVVTYDAVIDVDNPDLRLRPGMTANVTVVYAERKDAVAVPNTALRFRPPPEIAGSASSPSAPRGSGSAAPAGSASGRRGHPGGGGGGGGGNGGGSGGASDTRTIWLLRSGSPASEAVQVGLSDGTYTEVTGGDVHEGDDVITDATVTGAPAAPTTPSQQQRPPRMF